MAYLRRFKTKLQSRFINTEQAYEKTIFNTQVLVNSKLFITHSQWAHTILGSIIFGIILGYGKYYPVLSQMHYIFAIALAIIGVTVIKNNANLIVGGRFICQFINISFCCNGIILLSYRLTNY